MHTFHAATASCLNKSGELLALTRHIVHPAAAPHNVGIHAGRSSMVTSLLYRVGAAEAWSREFAMQQEGQQQHPERLAGTSWAEELTNNAAAGAPARPADGAAWASEFAGQTLGK